MEQNNFQPEIIEQEDISIVEIFFHYLRYWKFFILSILICVGLACAYLLYTTPEYKVFSRVVISDDKKGQTVDMMSAFSDLGITTPKNNVDNEIEILRSHTLMENVVDSLRLCVSYFKSGPIKKEEIYRNTPVFVLIPNIMKSGSFTVDKVNEDILSIHSSEETFEQEVKIGTELYSPWGVLQFVHNPFGTESFPIEVSVNPNFFPIIDINALNKTSSVVELSVITPTPQKGQDIINTLISKYNRNAIDDKNYVATNTIDFIEDRLQSIAEELDAAEKKVETFQKREGITNLHAQGQILLSSSSEYSKRIADAELQLTLLKGLKDHLMNPVNKDNIISSNVGLTDPTIISLIGKFNEENIKKARETEGMSENHPTLKDYNNRIGIIRNDLLSGISMAESSIQTNIKELYRQESMYMGKARELTTQERESRDLFRQQSLKETIFNYLLQKREETTLSLTMATPNAKVIDPAYFNIRPVKPRKMIVLLAALMLAIVIPVVIIYIRDLFDNKIHTKEDVTRAISAPFLGIIPVMKGENPFPVLKVRSSMTERFRSIISNLNFIVKNEEKKIISITSFTSGDGKSFFSRNLAMTLAITGKKTLLVDLDLRKSILIKTLGLMNIEKGSAVFLSDPKITIGEVIDSAHKFHENLDIIPVKVFPPNPAELLSSERLKQLFQEIAERDYEYIIIDTAPVGLVADIYSINNYSSATIFLLRSDYTPKKNLLDIQELYKDKKLNNLCIALNAVTDDNIYGYGGYKHDYYNE